MLGIDSRAARYTWTAALVLLVLWLIYLIRTTLFVFMVALLFAYLLSPLVNMIDRLLPGRRTRTSALALSYVIFLGIAFVVVTQIGARVVDQGNLLVKATPGLLQRFQQPTQAVSPDVNSIKAQIIQKIQEQVASSSGRLISALPGAGAKILSFASDLVYVVIIPILGFFFLKDGRQLRCYILGLVDSGSKRAMADSLLADADLLLAHYMRAILTLSLATFTSYSIFFSIVQVRFSILLGVIAGMLEFIPMIGPLSAGTIILIVTAVSGGPFLGSLIFLLVYRVFQDYVLSPLLMRAGMQMHPLLVLFGVFAGAELAGIPGAFLSVPLMALSRIIYRRMSQQRLALGEVSPPVVTPAE